LLQACPNLVALNLRNQTELTARVFLEIARLPNLHTLNLAGCRELADLELQAILSACPALARLSVMGCAQLSDVSAGALEQALEHLLQVDLCNTRGISKDARRRLARVDVTGVSLYELQW